MSCHRELSYINGKLVHMSRAEYLGASDGIIAEVDKAIEPQYASYDCTEFTCRPSHTWKLATVVDVHLWGAGEFSRAYRFRDQTTRKPITRAQFMVLVRAAQVDDNIQTPKPSRSAATRLSVDPQPPQRSTEPVAPAMRQPPGGGKMKNQKGTPRGFLGI